MNDIHNLTPYDYSNNNTTNTNTTNQDLSNLPIKRSRLDHQHHQHHQHSTEFIHETVETALIRPENDSHDSHNNNNDKDKMEIYDTGIKFTSSHECQHQESDKTLLSSAMSSSSTTITTQQTLTNTNVNHHKCNSYLTNENNHHHHHLDEYQQQTNRIDNEQDTQVQLQLNNHDSDDVTTEIDGSNGKLTLWQFLLELLLSNKYEHIIRWTNKRGEFILVQAEIVAKLWGMRKDKNHRMNYDKLSRALRYYYQKNIIRKVHGRKFVYQFIGLKHLIKFCCTSLNSTPMTTSVTSSSSSSSIITPTIVTSTLSTNKLQQTLTPLNTLPVHSKMDDTNLPVTSSLYHASKLNELYNHHHQQQRQDWFHTPHNTTTKFYETQQDCKYPPTTTSNITNTISNIITNANNCTLTSTHSENSSNLNCLPNNKSIYSPSNLDITTISTFINSYLNKKNFLTDNTVTNNNNDNHNNSQSNNTLPNHSTGESTISTLSDQHQIKTTHNEMNDFSDILSSWTSLITQQSNYLNNFRLMEFFKQFGLSNLLFNHQYIDEQFNVDQEKQTYSIDSCYRRIGQNDSLVNKEKIIENGTDNNNPFMTSHNIDHCSMNLRANYYSNLLNHYNSELSKIDDFITTPCEKDNNPPMNFTMTNLKESENFLLTQYVNQIIDRPRSPCCQCSCHSQATTLEEQMNYPLMQNIQHQINSSYLKDNTNHNHITEKLKDCSNKHIINGNFDELPTKLHNERHSINMKRLGEQLTRLNRLNSIGNYSNHHFMFTNKYSLINNNDNNLKKSNLMKDEHTTNYNKDSSNLNNNNNNNSNSKDDYYSDSEYKIPLTKNSMLYDSQKIPLDLNSSIMNTTYNSNQSDHVNISSLPTLSMSENKCVWMPVPVTMLNSWFNLLSNIKHPKEDNSTNQQVNFTTSPSFSTSSFPSSSMSSASLSSSSSSSASSSVSNN
ncbi:unnamed protein product [Schistosoma turkestanicum]|nr:unnamed protein product [Schistosoma turkestanicum]